MSEDVSILKMYVGDRDETRRRVFAEQQMQKFTLIVRIFTQHVHE